MERIRGQERGRRQEIRCHAQELKYSRAMSKFERRLSRARCVEQWVRCVVGAQAAGDDITTAHRHDRVTPPFCNRACNLEG
jgi:hypothetical protein